jgi:outer membrane protein assembly factor BamA
LSRSFSARTSASGGLQYENGRTKIDPAESCLRFNLCRPEEYAQSIFGRGVGILSATIGHDRTNNSIDPSGGYRLRAESRAGQTFTTIDSSVRFYRLSGDAARFGRAFGGVFAARLQLARAFAPGAQLVDGSPLLPQQERLFAGGQSSVRGYQQNLLGPLVYVVSDTVLAVNNGVTVIQADTSAGYDRAVPRGGTAMLVANLEYRQSFRWLAEQLQLAAFVDVGSIWEGATEPFKFGDLRATPGLGLRVITALGPFRVDVGYQPYAPRAGRALYVSKGVQGTGGVIRCASPGNTVPIGSSNGGGLSGCPDSYRPPSATGVLSKLAFHFGLGQAF